MENGTKSPQPSKKFKPDHKGAPAVKEKAFERPTIPVPATQDNSDVSDEDIGFFQENLATGGFLKSLDATAISR
jgi:nucleolar complex protein 3